MTKLNTKHPRTYPAVTLMPESDTSHAVWKKDDLAHSSTLLCPVCGGPALCLENAGISFSPSQTVNLGFACGDCGAWADLIIGSGIAQEDESKPYTNDVYWSNILREGESK